MKPKSFTNVIVSTTLIVLSIILTTVFACNKSAKIEARHLPEEINMPFRYNYPPIIHNIVGKRMDGSVTLYHSNNGEILISFKDKVTQEVTNSFILQTEGKGSSLAGIEKINVAEIIYLKDLVLLNNLDNGKIMLYGINSSDYNAIYQSIPENVRSQINETRNGFGLSYHKGTWERLNENISLQGSIYSGLYPHQHNSGERTNDEELECTSGGPGSTSCSISGCTGSPTDCSVSCATSYHACCRCSEFSGNAYCTCDSDS
jgi:hypothetical protein